MKSNNTSFSYFDALRNKIVNSKGGWRIGEAVYNHGFSMMRDLVGQHSYFKVMLLNVTGKVYSDEFCQWLEASYICMSWPDPRIWCNYIGALAGTSRTTPAAGVLAGTLASDSSMYGPGSLPKCMMFCQHLAALNGTDSEYRELLKSHVSSDGKVTAPGFSRPIAKGDERVEAMKIVSQKLGFEPGDYISAAMKFEIWLSKNYDENINIGGYTAAFLLDRGFTIDEVYRLTSTRVTAGVQACYAEYAEQPSGAFLPMAIDDCQYTGPKQRKIKN